MPENPIPPADWYADPADPNLLRWWDGTEWTDRLRPAAPLRPVRSRRTGDHLAEPSARPTPDDATSIDQVDPAVLRALPPPVVLASPPAVADIPGWNEVPALPEVRYRPAASRSSTRSGPRPTGVAGEVRNTVATVAIVCGVVVSVAFAILRSLDLSYAFGLGPAGVVLALSLFALSRARRTGAGVFRSVLALLVSLPLTAIAFWVFEVELVELVPL